MEFVMIKLVKISYTSVVLTILLSAFTPTQAAATDPELDAKQLVSAGDNHTCAISGEGKVYCWGAGTFGRLGNGSSLDSTVPQLVPLGSKAISVFAGPAHSCAIVSTGAVFCWGLNGSGQIDPSSSSDYFLTPVKVSGLSFPRSLSLSRDSTCALQGNGAVACWGDTTGSGSLGAGEYSRAMQEIMAANYNNRVVQISSGQFHTCALTIKSTVYCWGANKWGQLGQGNNENQIAPVPVIGTFSGASHLSAGGFHTCISNFLGEVQCWGRTFTKEHLILSGGGLSPTKFNGLANEGAYKQISAGYGHTCLLSSNGEASCWGDGSDGQLGNGQYYISSAVTQVIPRTVGDKFYSLSAGGSHTCGLTTSGKIMCWGANQYGQLGSGSLSPMSIPTSAIGITHANSPAVIVKSTQSVGRVSTKARKGASIRLPNKTNRGLLIRWTTLTSNICRVRNDSIVGIRVGRCLIYGKNSGDNSTKPFAKNFTVLITN